ncbi:ABC transporter permease [uncultured Oscillibacter sp.]|uniref:ABC transporter permease n=1 Tax=uncultured Oscillibacter sp. TaxID=876091 RepID=UPI00260EADAB|nr:ABC transporter permease [uncultured Oscillibacter sp.]
MGKYMRRRLLQVIPVLLIVTVVVFFMVHLSGDPTSMMLPQDATQEARENLREALGLNRPLHVQYWIFIKGLFQGDFGISHKYNAPALPIVLERIPASLELCAVSIVLSVVIAIPLGVWAARAHGTPFDSLVNALAVLGQAMPSFWIGIMLILLLGVKWTLLPVSGRGSMAQLIMPSVTLAIGTSAQIIPLVRSSMLEIVHEDYIRTARSKGLSERTVIYRHAFKNALVPVITMVALQIPALFGGALITETIFAWPGLGQLMVTGVTNHDMAIVQACILMITFITIVVNLCADMLYCLIDPRIRM